MTRLCPLGDRALLAYFADEDSAARFAAAARAAHEPGWLDVVPAYLSVAIHFDPERATIDAVAERMRSLAAAPLPAIEPRRHVIPCCYEMGPDLPRVAEFTGLTPDEIVRLHTSVDFTVYAIGFCPGFPYLGYLPAELSGVPRLESPRLRVEPGSVGLTCRQTGIYPLPRPGGWNLIGRTPLLLVDVAENFFPLKVGDRVRFECVGEATFRQLTKKRVTDVQNA